MFLLNILLLDVNNLINGNRRWQNINAEHR